MPITVCQSFTPPALKANFSTYLFDEFHWLSFIVHSKDSFAYLLTYFDDTLLEQPFGIGLRDCFNVFLKEFVMLISHLWSISALLIANFLSGSVH